MPITVLHWSNVIIMLDWFNLENYNYGVIKVYYWSCVRGRFHHFHETTNLMHFNHFFNIKYAVAIKSKCQ